MASGQRVKTLKKENRQKNGLWARQVCVRLAEDGTGFLYTVKLGPFRTAAVEVRLFGEHGEPAAPDAPDDASPERLPGPDGRPRDRQDRS